MIGTVCLLMWSFVGMIPYRLPLDVIESLSTPDMSPCRRLNYRIVSHELGTVVSGARVVTRCSRPKITKISLNLLCNTTSSRHRVGADTPSNEKRDPEKANGSRYGYIGLLQGNKNNWRFVSTFE